LVRACLTWVAVRRPGEALSHLLKLAAALAEDEPNTMLIAWESLTAVLLALGRAGVANVGAEGGALAGLGAADLRRALPEFLDWSDSVLAPGSEALPPFVSALRGLLEQSGPVDAGSLPARLAAVRALWREHGTPATGQPFGAAFTAAGDEDELPRARPKKRR
jgi:hypothetical protein